MYLNCQVYALKSTQDILDVWLMYLNCTYEFVILLSVYTQIRK